MMALISTAIICNSKFVARQFDRTVAGRVRVIPNGVPLSASAAQADPCALERIGLVSWHLSGGTREQGLYLLAGEAAEPSHIAAAIEHLLARSAAVDAENPFEAVISDASSSPERPE